MDNVTFVTADRAQAFTLSALLLDHISLGPLFNYPAYRSLVWDTLSSDEHGATPESSWTEAGRILERASGVWTGACSDPFINDLVELSATLPPPSPEDLTDLLDHYYTKGRSGHRRAAHRVVERQLSPDFNDPKRPIVEDPPRATPALGYGLLGRTSAADLNDLGFLTPVSQRRLYRNAETPEPESFPTPAAPSTAERLLSNARLSTAAAASQLTPEHLHHRSTCRSFRLEKTTKSDIFRELEAALRAEPHMLWQDIARLHSGECVRLEKVTLVRRVVEPPVEPVVGMVDIFRSAPTPDHAIRTGADFIARLHRIAIIYGILDPQTELVVRRYADWLNTQIVTEKVTWEIAMAYDVHVRDNVAASVSFFPAAQQPLLLTDFKLNLLASRLSLTHQPAISAVGPVASTSQSRPRDRLQQPYPPRVPCFRFNDKRGCPGCGRPHVCSLCGGEHSATKCDRAPVRAPVARGGGAMRRGDGGGGGTGGATQALNPAMFNNLGAHAR